MVLSIEKQEELKELFPTCICKPLRVFECSDCPFGSVSLGREDEVNPADPGEGYYDCALMGIKENWGEDPKCEDRDWRDYFNTHFDIRERQNKGDKR